MSYVIFNERITTSYFWEFRAVMTWFNFDDFGIIVVLFIIIAFVIYYREQTNKRLYPSIKTGLFLDDERYPDDVTWIDYPKGIQWTVVRTPDQFIEAIHAKPYDYYSFDHDLGPDTILDGKHLLNRFCSYLLDHVRPDLPVVYFHTKNPIGRDNMKSYWTCFVNSSLNCSLH